MTLRGRGLELTLDKFVKCKGLTPGSSCTQTQTVKSVGLTPGLFEEGELMRALQNNLPDFPYCAPQSVITQNSLSGKFMSIPISEGL